MNLLHGARNRAFAALFLAACAAAAAESRSVDVRLVGGRLEAAPRTIRLTRGEELVLRVGSDEELTVHVHGYDIVSPVHPGMSATLAIRARLVGRFPVTAHLPEAKGSGKRRHEPVLLYLEVHPE